MRSLSVMTLLCATIGCAVGPAETTFKASSPAAFAGAWRYVTPSLEFIGLSVTSKSSEMGVLGARLTFSGVAWEGGGRIEGDSLVSAMAIVGALRTKMLLILVPNKIRFVCTAHNPPNAFSRQNECKAGRRSWRWIGSWT